MYKNQNKITLNKFNRKIKSQRIFKKREQKHFQKDKEKEKNKKNYNNYQIKKAKEMIKLSNYLQNLIYYKILRFKPIIN